MKKKEIRSKWKKILKAAGIAVLVLILIAGITVSVVTGNQVAYGLLHVNDGNDTGENSVTQLEEWGYDLAGFEAKYQPEYAELAAEDGNLVPIWYFETPGSVNTVILLHGLGGDHTFVYPLAEMYLKKGYNVITCDQRGTEKNGSGELTYGYMEKLDTRAIVDYAKNEMASEKIVVHGQSMGGANAALYGTTEHAAENVDAVILDSCIPSMEYVFLGSMELDGAMGAYLVFCGNISLKLQRGFGFEDTDICEQVKNMKVDTLMLHMERDELVPDRLAEKMYQNIGAGRKELHTFDSEHIKGFFDEPEQYEAAVFAFLGE